ncbi:hypothetical protein CHUAL_014043 [Chamberlinius hualienensis]
MAPAMERNLLLQFKMITDLGYFLLKWLKKRRARRQKRTLYFLKQSKLRRKTHFNFDCQESFLSYVIAETANKGLRKHRFWVKHSEKSSKWAVNLVHGEWLDDDYISYLRVSRTIFAELCNELKDKMTTKDTNFRKCIPLEIKIGAALYYLAETCSCTTVANFFGLGNRSVFNSVHLFCATVKEKLLKKYLPTPTESTIKDFAKTFQDKYGMVNVIGCIDGCHIPVICPDSAKDIDYFNRKSFYSVILQGIVDHSGSFWNVNVGWPGSVHDEREFTTSAIYKQVSKGFLPQSEVKLRNIYIPYYLIGDGAYPLLEWVMKPFAGPNLSEKEQYFNNCLSIPRITVEHAFGRLKGRWRRLLKTGDCSLEHAINFVICCVILHNMCEKYQVSFDCDMETQNDLKPKFIANTNDNSLPKCIRNEIMEDLWINK